MALVCSIVFSCASTHTMPTPSTTQNPIAINTTPKTVIRDLSYNPELNFSMIRIPIKWDAVEVSRGKFNWRQMDKLINKSNAKNTGVLLNLRCISKWGAVEETKKSVIYHSASPPRDYRDWENFLEKLVTRYKGRNVHYEIDNEVNAVSFWTGTLDEYLELLKRSYTVIKRHDPEAVVLHSGMACGVVRNLKKNRKKPIALERHDPWLAAILATKAFDAVNVHNYYFPSDVRANGLTFQSYMQNILSLMRQAGVAHKPIWITEAGYISTRTNASGRWDPGTPENQAKWFREAYNYSLGIGVEKYFWLITKDRQEPYFGSMGLADKNGNPRPAWNMMQQLSTQY